MKSLLIALAATASLVTLSCSKIPDFSVSTDQRNITFENGSITIHTVKNVK